MGFSRQEHWRGDCHSLLQRIIQTQEDFGLGDWKKISEAHWGEHEMKNLGNLWYVVMGVGRARSIFREKVKTITGEAYEYLKNKGIQWTNAGCIPRYDYQLFFLWKTWELKSGTVDGFAGRNGGHSVLIAFIFITSKWGIRKRTWGMRRHRSRMISEDIMRVN